MTVEERDIIRERIMTLENSQVRTAQEFDRREERLAELRENLNEV